MKERDAVIVAACRTPIGKYGGSLSSVRPDDLAALVIKKVIESVPVDQIDDIYFGCANQAGEDNRNIARMAVLLAGLPVSVPGVTVNRLCGSGLEAINQAAKAIMVGEGDIFIAGGIESMSRAPLAMPKSDRAFPNGNFTVFDTSIGWRFINKSMSNLYGTESMGETAENLAKEYAITREEQDEFALHSHQKAVRARARLAEEIISVEVINKKGTNTVSQDEGPRQDASLEALAKLKPAFRTNGTVTAGNASGLNDGAAALVITSFGFANAHGLKILSKISSFATAGVSPRIMGIGPVPATQKVLTKLGLKMSDLSVIELNEAFSAQSLAVLRNFHLDFHDSRLNPNGGAIALGHPLGMSGARLAITTSLELQKRGGFGLATMCIGVGQGIATIFEAVG